MTTHRNQINAAMIFTGEDKASEKALIEES